MLKILILTAWTMNGWTTVGCKASPQPNSDAAHVAEARESSTQVAATVQEVPASEPSTEPSSEPSTAPSQQDRPQQPREPVPDPAPAPGAQEADRADAGVEALLDRLEASAADLRSFTADLRYEKEDAILGRKELRSGSLIYSNPADQKRKRFAILFDRTIVQNVGRDESRHFIFDGRWLAEVDHTNRQFIKREIVPPGREFDPLKLGEGPFPLPIGQPKAEVLARFNVTAIQPPDAGLLKDLKDVDGLLLVPKPGVPEAKDYSKVELFYDRATNLPVGINTVETNGERKTVRLLNVQRNPELNKDQQAKLDINEPDPRKWKVDVRPWAGG